MQLVHPYHEHSWPPEDLLREESIAVHRSSVLLIIWPAHRWHWGCILLARKDETFFHSCVVKYDEMLSALVLFQKTSSVLWVVRRAFDVAMSGHVSAT
ncbi:unnamed protein product [Strongylus vulgaris]|uniref:Uncharacterized protein n=1 Tax=Strongylus vulgaris TaxID=40348 RepID=A0A3P7JM98_STRVU|nr:unnamed protein product [Strongylus vulgaris]